MMKRLLMGPVLIALLVLLLWGDQRVQGAPTPGVLHSIFGSLVGETLAPGTLILPACILIAFFASREMAALLIADGIVASKRAITTASIVGLLVSCVAPAVASAPVASAIVSSAAVAVLVAAMVFSSRNKTVEGVIASTGGVLLSFVYLGLMFGFVLAIRRHHEAWVLLWILLITKSCDIGAYFTGKAVGRHKLIPWLSPGKTWEGLVGGVVLSAVVGAVGMTILERTLHVRTPVWWHGAMFGAVLGLVGQVGDLLESLLKRDAGSKDSGSSLPGFGGVLDVLDSPLLTMPFAFWWLHVATLKGYFAG